LIGHVRLGEGFHRKRPVGKILHALVPTPIDAVYQFRKDWMHVLDLVPVGLVERQIGTGGSEKDEHALLQTAGWRRPQRTGVCVNRRLMMSANVGLPPE